MFNTNYYKSETKVCPVTQVVEKTISPDKVTEMYDKVYAEVQNNYVKNFDVKSDYLNGTVVEFSDEYNTLQRKVMTRFNLNGQEYTFLITIQSAKELKPEQLYEIFVNHYRDELMKKLFNPLSQIMFKKVYPPLTNYH